MLVLLLATMAFVIAKSPHLKVCASMAAGAAILLLVLGITLKLPCELKHNTPCYFKVEPREQHEI